MIIEPPRDSGFTFYSLKDCIKCKVSEHLLKAQYGINYFGYVLCDKYIEEDREEFIQYMKSLTKEETIKFPIIFVNGEYRKTTDIIK